MYYLYECTLSSIFKKGIDANEPIKWLSGLGCAWGGRILRVGNNGEVILHNDQSVIRAIHSAGTLGIQLKRPVNENIVDFQPLGFNQEQVICLSINGTIWVYEYDIPNQTSRVVAQKQMTLLEKRSELADCLAVCNQSRYIAVSTKDYASNLSRIVVYEFLKEKEVIEYRTCKDYFDKQLKQVYCMVFDVYYYNHVVIVGLTHAEKSHLLVFDYDVEGISLREIKKLRRELNFDKPAKMVRFEDTIFSSDEYSKILKLTFKL